MSTGITCDEEVTASFNGLKLQTGGYKGCKYITYKINDEKTHIVVDTVGEVGKGYDDFLETLPGNDCRYAVVDIDVETSDGRETSKLVFISWVPDTCKVRSKMMYAGSKETLKVCFAGLGIHYNANDYADLDFETCIKPAVLKFV
eukprot:CAMPEP_0197736840 /NCGR_PEP_ID=MMETSP1435-20131217/4638_1 /TAXON_ID=426625 /ORGANISM="Chaetoceros brevis, Strain CCMP164" /LENGTH=144 /DNA_ID=CAMNT_0043325111 /DNA_START=14 /DNA_END=448 /DNA_ORIENTATION=-